MMEHPPHYSLSSSMFRHFIHSFLYSPPKCQTNRGIYLIKSQSAPLYLSGTLTTSSHFPGTEGSRFQSSVPFLVRLNHFCFCCGPRGPLCPRSAVCPSVWGCESIICVRCQRETERRVAGRLCLSRLSLGHMPGFLP